MIEAVKKARRETLLFAVMVFTGGQVVGIILFALYVTYITGSSAKYFHAYVMWVGPGFAFPFFSISYRIMLKMYYKALEQEEKFAAMIETVERKEEKIDPIINKVESIATTVKEVTDEGKLKDALEAVTALPIKMDKLITKVEEKGIDNTIDNL